MLIDYHLHNHFSPDSETDTVELIEKAQKGGIHHICITNHAEIFVEGEGIPGIFEMEEATKRFLETKKEIDGLKPQFPDMSIGFGVELQYQKEFMTPLKTFEGQMDFDFILGSVHTVENVQISGGGRAGDLYEKVDEKTAYTKYFENMLKLIEWGQLDAVAHFDICKKYGHEYYGPFQPQKYKPIIVKILQTMKEKGIGIELNTGSLHKRCKELFPHPDILKWCVEIGLDHFTLGSDAHKVDEIGRHLNEAVATAKEVGISTVSTYEERKPTKYKV